MRRFAWTKKSDRPRGPTAEVVARPVIRLGRVFAIPITARQPQLLVSMRQLVVCLRQREETGIPPCSDELSIEPILCHAVSKASHAFSTRAATLASCRDTPKFVVSGMALCQNSPSLGATAKGVENETRDVPSPLFPILCKAGSLRLRLDCDCGLIGGLFRGATLACRLSGRYLPGAIPVVLAG